MDAGPGALFHRQLTRRQAECVALLAKGLSSKEIARELGISPSTVDNHIASVMHQLNLSSRSAIARFADIQPHASPEVPAEKIIPIPGHRTNSEFRLDHDPDVHLCGYCKTKAYFRETFLPSLVFALQCSIFLILFFMILRYFVDIGF